MAHRGQIEVLTGTSSKSASIASWRRVKHRKLITVFAILIFSLLGFCWWMDTSADQASSYLRAQPLTEYPYHGILVVPARESEIWSIDDQLYVYGRFYIINTTNDVYSIRLFNSYIIFEGNWLSFNASEHHTGNHTLVLTMYNYTQQETTIHVSRYDRVVSTASPIVGMLLLTSYGFGAGVLVLYLIVARPIQKELAAFLSVTHTQEIPDTMDERTAKLVVDKTSHLIRHLSTEIACIRSEKSSLLTAVGVLVAGYGFIVSEVLGKVLDSNLVVSTFLSVFVGILGLIISAHYILSDSSVEDPEATLWHYTNRVTEPIQGKISMGSDIARTYDLVSGWKTTDYAKDNVREVVSLYHAYRITDEQCVNAKTWIRISLTLFLAFFVFFLFIFSPFGDYITVGYFGFSGGYVLLLGSYKLKEWLTKPLKAERGTLFRCRNRTDTTKAQNKDIDKIDNLLAVCNVSVIETCSNDAKVIERIQTIMKAGKPDKGKKPKDQDYVFSVNKKHGTEWAGKEVPLLFTEYIGENTGIEVYPHRDKNRLIVTIYDHLVKLEKE